MATSGAIPTPFVGSGVKQDLHLLFNKFSAANSTRIRDFADVFRELRFETILNYRTSPAEYTEFAEYLLQNAALYFGKENEVRAKRSFTERVFGIYTCYALFNLQPLDHVCQIPVTELQFKELVEFQEVLISAKALEPVAALKQLFIKKAFRLIIFQSTYDPATHKRYLSEEEMPDFGRQPIEPFARVKTVQAHKTIGEIMYIHNAYLEAKKKFGITGIQLVDRVNPVEEIQKQIEKHQKELERRLDKSDSSSGKNSEMPPESAGSSRSTLKSKAYGAKLKHTRQRRWFDPNMEENFKNVSRDTTLGQIAQECLEEGSSEQKSTEKPKPKKRRRVIKEDLSQPLNDEELAEEVLREEYAARTKPETTDVEEAQFGGKKCKQGTSGVAKIRAPPKRKDRNIVAVKVERRDDADCDAPNASQIDSSFKSPQKKVRKSAAKPRISDEWSSKLQAWSGQLKATDKELKKLTSSIKIEESDD